MTKIAIDIDGVITANPPALSWLTYHLAKNENKFKIYILSWRDGSDELRKKETIDELKSFGIKYDELIMAPKRLGIRAAAFWKIATLAKLEINIWLDDEIKIYERDFAIDLNRLLPNVVRVWI